jgi:hypothetical protein
MTVAVSCNTAEGVILGVDSALTLTNDQGQVLKTYENAAKLFQLGQKPIGIATFGLDFIGNRIVGSYLLEFEGKDPGGVVTKPASMETTVEELRKFFLEPYERIVVPLVEQKYNKKFSEVPNTLKPTLGLSVGGFSSGAHLSEVWQVLIPFNDKPKSATLVNGQGDFRSTWYALNEPIVRYHKGYDLGVLGDLKDYFVQLRGSPFTPQEETAINAILAKHEYQIPVGAMPMVEAIAYVKFLVEMVINHHRFAVGAPVVGGKVQIGVVSYKGNNFRIFSPPEMTLTIPENVIV